MKFLFENWREFVGEGYDSEEFEFDKMSDKQLADMADADGIEEILVFDLDGDLANRDEVIAALKNHSPRGLKNV